MSIKKDTQCVHSGGIFGPVTGGVNTPTYPSLAFEYRDRQDVPYPRYFIKPK